MTLGLKYELIIRHHLISDAPAELTHQFLRRMLSVCISSWCISSRYTSVPDAYAKHVLKVPIQISYVRSVHESVPDSYAQCKHQFLTRMLTVSISTWHVWSVHVSVPDLYDQCAHKGQSTRIRKSKILIIFLSTWKSQYFKKSLLLLRNGLKSSTEKFVFAQTLKKSSLKLDWADA